MDQERSHRIVDLIEARRLLDGFSALKIRDERPKTFMEIAGVPRGENVCSSILAFFLDPEESHGLGTLVLDALADAGASYKTFANRRTGGKVSVKREVFTDKVPDSENKKIDILIETDDHVIVIENKTAKNPRIENPFDVYAAYQDEIAGNRQKLKILLTVTPSSAGSEEGFDNITHVRLVRTIRERLGRHASGADMRCLTLFLDFLNTLENLKEETRMDQKLIAFLAKRRVKVTELLTNVEDFNKELEKKGKELRSLIDMEDYENVEQWFECDHKELYCDLGHDIQISETLTILLEASIHPEGWQIWLWPHDSDEQELTDLSEARHVVDLLAIPADEHHDLDDGYDYTVFRHRLSFDHDHHETLGYYEDIESVADLVQGLIDKLATEGAENL